MSVFTSFAGKIRAEFEGASVPLIDQVNMASAGTEYSYLLPDNCKQFMIKLQGDANLQVAYLSGDSGIKFITVPRFCFLSESDLGLSAATTLYFQSNKASQVLEIISWT